MSGTYIIGVPGAAHVTGHVTNTVSLAPGIPITETTVPQAALLAGLFTDSDAFLAPAIAGSAPTLSLLPSLLTGSDTFNAPSIVAEMPGTAARAAGCDQRYGCHLAAAVGRVLKPSLVPAEDIVSSASAVLVLRPALLSADDVVYNFTNTRFVQPSLSVRGSRPTATR